MLSKRLTVSKTVITDKAMEFLNRIEIQGIVGSVKITPVGDTRVARFSVCTETTYNGAGGIVIGCCGFTVACQSEKITWLDHLGKGKIVRVLGRVRVQRYTDETGAERNCWEVLAHKLEIMEG